MSKEMNNEWLTKMLQGGNKDEISQYTDLVNRRSSLDDIGDAFLDQSKQPALNGGQGLGNAVKAGLGAGFKANANAIREDKLKEIEQYTKDSALATAELQAQLGEEKLNQLSYTKYANNSYVDLLKLKDAYVAEDMNSFNQLGMQFYNNFAQAHPELVEGMGKIDHIYNGKAYFNNDDGETEGVYIKDLLEPLISKLSEEQQRELAPLMSTTMQNKFKKSDLFEDLSLREKQSAINANNASANLHNAQAGVANKPKINEHVANKTFDTNVKWMDDQDKIVDNSILKNKVLDKLELILGRESAAGGTPWDAVKRYYKSKTGDDKDLTEAKLLQKYFFSDIKGIAGNPNLREWEDLVGRIISTGQNVDGALSVLNFERELNNESIQRYQATVEELQANDYGLLYNDPRIQAKVKERIGGTSRQDDTSSQMPDTNNNQQQDAVVMTNSVTGEQYEVPSDKIELFKQNGYE